MGSRMMGSLRLLGAAGASVATLSMIRSASTPFDKPNNSTSNRPTVAAAGGSFKVKVMPKTAAAPATTAQRSLRTCSWLSSITTTPSSSTVLAAAGRTPPRLVGSDIPAPSSSSSVPTLALAHARAFRACLVAPASPLLLTSGADKIDLAGLECSTTTITATPTKESTTTPTKATTPTDPKAAQQSAEAAASDDMMLQPRTPPRMRSSGGGGDASSSSALSHRPLLRLRPRTSTPARSQQPLQHLLQRFVAIRTPFAVHLMLPRGEETLLGGSTNGLLGPLSCGDSTMDDASWDMSTSAEAHSVRIKTCGTAPRPKTSIIKAPGTSGHVLARVSQLEALQPRAPSILGDNAPVMPHFSRGCRLTAGAAVSQPRPTACTT